MTHCTNFELVLEVRCQPLALFIHLRTTAHIQTGSERRKPTKVFELLRSSLIGIGPGSTARAVDQSRICRCPRPAAGAAPAAQSAPPRPPAATQPCPQSGLVGSAGLDGVERRLARTAAPPQPLRCAHRAGPSRGGTLGQAAFGWHAGAA